LTEEALDIQKESASRINDLFKKLKDIQDYAKKNNLTTSEVIRKAVDDLK